MPASVCTLIIWLVAGNLKRLVIHLVNNLFHQDENDKAIKVFLPVQFTQGKWFRLVTQHEPNWSIPTSNFDEKFKNVFYVGASTIPGAGLPMAIISSKLAFERIETFFK